MTRTVHDEFAKNYLGELLEPYGIVKTAERVRSEGREIDVFFQPSREIEANRNLLGLLGEMIETPALFEPFRNPATADEIGDCLIKSLETRRALKRKALRKGSNKTKLTESDLPRLWILTPTESTTILSEFAATSVENWVSGIYFLPIHFRAAIVVIHQLPQNSDTLWLRLLGKGKVQERAIDELERLSPDNPFRENTLKSLFSLLKDLERGQEESEDRELIMRLSPLYLQDREQAIQEGIEQGIEQGIQQGQQQGILQGERLVLENLLVARFGSLDDELAAIIEPILELPAAEFTPMLLQLSREELLARFS